MPTWLQQSKQRKELKDMRWKGIGRERGDHEGPVDSVNILDFSLCKMEVFGRFSEEKSHSLVCFKRIT